MSMNSFEQLMRGLGWALRVWNERVRAAKVPGGDKTLPDDINIQTAATCSFVRPFAGVHARRGVTQRA